MRQNGVFIRDRASSDTLQRRAAQVPWALVGLAGLALAIGGCARGMDDIDRRTQRLLSMTSERVRAGTPGDRTPPTEVSAGRETRSKSPDTTNPAAPELSYSVADEARDVSARLDAYVAQSQPADAATALVLNLDTTLKIAQTSAAEYLAAEEDYIFAALRLLVERHLWGPRLFNDTSVTVSGQGTDGSFQSALRVLNELRVTQRLPYGGSVEAAWLWQATEQLREQSSGSYTQSSALALSGNVPLLRGAGWVAQESLIQAERDLVYQARRFEDFRRSFLVRVAREYFALVEAQKRLRNQEARVKLLEQITAGETARYEAGRIAEFRRNVAQNNLLSAQASLAGQREQFIVDAEQFKIRLGLPSGTPALIVEQELDLPEPEVGLDRAVALAMEYRLDLQNLRDQLDDRRRGLANARNALLPEADVTASVSMPTDPRDRVGGLSFSPGDVNYSAGITFGLPLDREAERVALRQQSIALQRAVREYDRTRDEIAVEVRQSVRRIDLARFQLNIAEQQVEINRRRVLETDLKADEVETQFKVDAANALQDAENERDRTRTALRNAVLDYLRQSGQLRVGRDGQFERLPGMGEARPGSTRLSEPPAQPGAVTP